MDNIKTTDVNTLGEFGLINHLTDDVVLKHASTIKGIGDDAAVIDSGDFYTLVATDMLVEGIHFDLVYTPLKHLGYKAVVVNLSDIYAMNGIPKYITVSIAISSKYTVEALEELYAGIHLACDLYNVDLIGGDTTSSPKGMTISITAVGEVDKDKVVYRNGAMADDLICLTGSLGAAYLGLQILEREKQIYLQHPDLPPQIEDHEYLVGRLLKPEARKDAIAFFEENQIVPTSMIDISDGLASELLHLCTQSNTGALIEEGRVPIHPDAEKQAIAFQLNPIVCALNGGEDYELLFTVPNSDFDVIQYMPDVFIIGNMKQRNHGVKLLTTGEKIHTITAQGWNHFNV